MRSVLPREGDDALERGLHEADALLPAVPAHELRPRRSAHDDAREKCLHPHVHRRVHQLRRVCRDSQQGGGDGGRCPVPPRYLRARRPRDLVTRSRHRVHERHIRAAAYRVRRRESEHERLLARYQWAVRAPAPSTQQHLAHRRKSVEQGVGSVLGPSRVLVQHHAAHRSPTSPTRRITCSTCSIRACRPT